MKRKAGTLLPIELSILEAGIDQHMHQRYEYDGDDYVQIKYDGIGAGSAPVTPAGPAAPVPPSASAGPRRPAARRR